MRTIVLIVFFLICNLNAYAQYTELPLSVIDVPPYFSGCDGKLGNDAKSCFMNNLKDYILKGIYYPDDLKAEGINGRVYTVFDIDSTGRIVNIRARAPHKSLKEIVVNRIKALPKLTPGQHQGKNVNTVVSCPITFKLTKQETRLARAKREASGGFNPSNTILLIDALAKGEKIETGKIVFGEEVVEMTTKIFDGFLMKAKNQGVLTFDQEAIFKMTFYGKFESISDQILFEDLYNSFIFYSQRYFGNDYSPNITKDSFTMKYWTERTDDLGIKHYENEYEIDFEIFMPKAMKSNFLKYKKDSQFAYENGSFITEYIVVSFLEKYNPESLEFKQMLQNLYRFSNKMPPAKTVSELKML